MILVILGGFLIFLGFMWWVGLGDWFIIFVDVMFFVLKCDFNFVMCDVFGGFGFCVRFFVDDLLFVWLLEIFFFILSNVFNFLLLWLCLWKELEVVVEFLVLFLDLVLFVLCCCFEKVFRLL